MSPLDSNTPEQILNASKADFTFRAGTLEIGELNVFSFRATESISRPFHVRMELASRNWDLVLDELVGKPGVLRIAHRQRDLDHWINGVVSRFEYIGQGARFARYECELVPLIWLLGLRRNSRIFQEMSVPDILKKVFEDAGLPNDCFQMKVTKTYPKREYCVQYRETELDFVMRLMEEEGIFYYFTHTEKAHVMVIGDNPSAHVPILGKPQVLYRAPSAMVEGEEFVTHFRLGQKLSHGRVSLRDFDFTQPKLNLDAEHKDTRDDALEYYEYPGEYADPNVGKALAKVRMEEVLAGKQVASANTVVRRMIAGHRFTLEDHAREDFNGEYLITRVAHTGRQPGVLEEEAEAAGKEGFQYENVIEAIPYAVPFRPARVTPRPLVQGTQTAIVVGPSGEEIYTDKYGRVKVKFPWDREGKHDENASCWIRVSQFWAGGKYGSIFLPRVAHEVIVDFLEGNPDQPIIVGRVYNGDEMPPYALAEKKNISTIRTASSKGQDGANELRFDDTAGAEQIFMHAEHDLHVRVKCYKVETIGSSESESVGGDKMVEIGGDHSRKVKGEEAKKIDGNLSLDVGGNVAEKIAGNHSDDVTGNVLIKTGGTIVLEAGGGATIKCGGNHVTIDASGVTIVGSMVKINSGGAALSDSAGTLTGPAAPAAADKEQPGKDTSYTAEVKPPKKITPTVIDETETLDIKLIDKEGNAVPGEPYKVITAEGKEIPGNLDPKGEAHVTGLKPGGVKVVFPRIDDDEVDKVS